MRARQTVYPKNRLNPIGVTIFRDSFPKVAAKRGNPGLWPVTASRYCCKKSGLDQSFLRFVEQYSIQPITCALLLLVAVMSFACVSNTERRTIPTEVESTIATISEEISAERYEKIYNQASELWRQDATLEESIATFKTLRTKLGLVENRMLQSATEQENSGGLLKGRAYIVTYRTKFQNGAGMETFTLVERDGRWSLARYFVNSTALK